MVQSTLLEVSLNKPQIEKLIALQIYEYYKDTAGIYVLIVFQFWESSCPNEVDFFFQLS
jgi:hypothetical protein